MDWKLIWDIAEIVLMVVIFVIGAYYRKSAVLREYIAELILDAEEYYAKQEKAGELKMAWVVGQVYDFIPAIFKPILTKDRIKEIVQGVFDYIAAYADIQVAKLKAAYEAKKKVK